MHNRIALISYAFVASFVAPLVTSCGGGAGDASGAGASSARNVACTYFGGALGGVGNDRAEGVALIPTSENVVICGNTTSNDYALRYPGLPGWKKTLTGGSDAFVAILSKDLTHVIAWSYFGGDDTDRAYAVRVDPNGDIWMSGFTMSSNFPVVGGTPHAGAGGTEDAFVVRFSPNLGSLQFSTCIGGSNDESPRASIALDDAGNVYLSGKTDSPDFPVQAAIGETLYDATYNGNDDGWIAKLDPSGNILWATYFGGSENDSAWSGIALNADQQSIYFAGYTRSDVASGFPAINGFDTTYNGDAGPSEPALGDGFVARMTVHGQLLACTYIGGTAGDCVSPNACLIVTPQHKVAVGGQARSASSGPNAFPITANALQKVKKGPDSGGPANDAFVAVFDETLASLEYCSYFGGTDSDDLAGLVCDANGRFYFTGTTLSSDFPTTANAFQRTHTNTIDGIIVSFGFDASATTLFYSTYISGKTLVGAGFEGDRGRTLVLRPSDGLAVISGDSDTSDFPTTPLTLDPLYIGGVSDAIVAIHDVH